MNTEKIYPRIASAPQQEPMDANNYRIQKILDIQNMLEKEKDQRRKTYKKYSKGIDVTDEVLATATVGMGVTGLALLSTVVIIMEGASIATGALCFIAKYVNKKLKHKADKHQKILTLSESKLNTINNHISKAIEDGRISEEEFKLILEEETKFREMKKEMKDKKISPQAALEFEKGRQETLQQVKSFLEKSKSK